MNTTTTSVNVILNQWSLTIQVAILSVFVIIFFALKLRSQRRVINSWFWAWLSNAIALFMVIFVLVGTEYFTELSLRIFYTSYAIAKIGYSVLLFIGLYQLLQERNPFSLKTKKLLLISGILFCFISLGMSFKLLTIQISVYTIVGLIFLISAIIQMKIFWFKDTKIILLVFLTEGIMFLHHSIVLIPVSWGEALPAYMTHISFFDAILELIVGISCLYVIANQVNNEISKRNSILSTSQNALRKLVNVDPLTGLWHRRYFDTFLKQYNSGASLVFLKIDQLPEINDEWGYSVGDLCIKEMSKVMQNVFDREDGLFRIKGNSFLIIAPGVDKDLIQRKVQKLKNQVAANPLCAPILSLSDNISTYQKKTDLHHVLSENTEL